VNASSVDVTSGDRTLVGPLLLGGPADAGIGRIRRTARGVRTRDGRRGAAGVEGDAGGRSGRRIGRTTVSKADDFWTSNSKSGERISPDVGPLESIIHSGEGGEIAGRWLVSASVLHVNLNATRIILGLSGRVEGNDLITNQVFPRGEPSRNGGSPLITIGDQPLRSPLCIRVSTFINLKPFTAGSRE